LTREKERLEKAEEAFRALDLNKVILFIYCWSQWWYCLLVLNLIV
jgi:hypothetical protein